MFGITFEEVSIPIRVRATKQMMRKLGNENGINSHKGKGYRKRRVPHEFFCFVSIPIRVRATTENTLFS